MNLKSFSQFARVRKFVRLWRTFWGFFPLSWGGLLAVVGLGGYFVYFGISQQDRVLALASVSMLACGAIALTFNTLAGLLLLWRWRHRPAEAGSKHQWLTGQPGWLPLTVSLPRWIFVDLDWAWTVPEDVKVELQKNDGAYCEAVTFSQRCLVNEIERRFVVRDVLGIGAMRWTSRQEVNIQVLPAPVPLDDTTLIQSLCSGDEVPDPWGDPVGDRVDMRRYASGDPPRLLLWKIFARSRKLMVRIPERALSPMPRTCAYLVAGPCDELAAGLMRSLLEADALGTGWCFGADGNFGIASTTEQALTFIARSGNAESREQTGLGTFLEQTRSQGFESCLVGVPAADGPWVAAVQAAVRRADINVNFVCATDRRPADTTVRKPEWAERWNKVLFHPDSTAPSPEPERVLRHIGRGAHGLVYYRATGQVVAVWAELWKGLRLRDLGASLMWSLACGLMAYLWTIGAAVLTSAGGGFWGCWAGLWLARTRVRLPSALLGMGLVYGLLAWVSDLPANSPLLAGALNANNAYDMSQMVGWGFQSFFAVATLRFLSQRYPSLTTLEILTVALMLARPLAAHRNGFINRPYFLVDPLLSEGRDPLEVLFYIGALVTVVLIVLIVGRRTRRVSFWDFGVLFLMLFFLVALLPVESLKQILSPPPGTKQSDPKPKPKDGKSHDKQQGNGKDPMPMENPPPSEGQSSSPVAVVLLRDDYTPPYGIYYFRQTSFSEFNGKRLVADVSGKYDVDIVKSFPTDPLVVPSPGPHNSTFYRPLKTLVALVDEDQTKPFGLVNTVKMSPAENPSPSIYARAWECESEVLQVDFQNFLNNPVGSQQWTPDDWKHYTDLPKDPRYKALADKIVSRLSPTLANLPMARALAIKFYLDDTVTYTMKFNHDGAEDMVADYLFVNPKGYCVHQAHAAVYLMRALGLPARVGAGYATDARNRAGGSTILLRQGEAHAWPELYVQDVGWVVIDISPKKTDAEPMAPPDPGLQRMHGEKARGKDHKSAAEKKLEPRSIQPMLHETAVDLIGLVLWSLAALIGGLYAVKGYRRIEPVFCSRPRMGVAALRSALDELAEVGETRAFGEGRLEFAKRLGYESLVPLTEAHFAATLGRSPVESNRIVRLRDQVHQQIAKRHPWWRRLLGLIDPTSWLRAR